MQNTEYKGNESSSLKGILHILRIHRIISHYKKHIKYRIQNIEEWREMPNWILEMGTKSMRTRPEWIF